MKNWKRLKFFRIMKQINQDFYIIGKDSGTFGSYTYYYVELNDKVIMHGFITQKSAKKYVEDLINNN